MFTRFASLVVAVLAVLGAPSLRAAEVYVPTALEPWRAWVLDRHPELACPPVYSDATVRPCVWIRSLDVTAENDAARFTMDVDVFAPADVVVPGNTERWPADVRVDGGAGVVTQLSARPRLRLDAGRYTVSGRIHWSKMPESLPVPNHHGLLRLTIDG